MQCINWFGGAAGKRDALLHGAYGLGPNKKMMLAVAKKLAFHAQHELGRGCRHNLAHI